MNEINVLFVTLFRWGPTNHAKIKAENKIIIERMQKL